MTYCWGGDSRLNTAWAEGIQGERHLFTLQREVFGYNIYSALSHVWLFITPWAVATPRLLCPWDFPGKNTGLGCHFLFQRIFLIQGLNPHLLCLLHWQAEFFCFFFFYHGATWKFQCVDTVWKLAIIKYTGKKKMEVVHRHGSNVIFNCWISNLSGTMKAP